MVPPNDSTLAAKICQILSRLLKHQSIRLSVHSSGAANALIQWCSKVLANAGELALPDAMSSLEMLLRGRAVTADPHVSCLNGKYRKMGELRP
jgi:hypothetical protein